MAAVTAAVALDAGRELHDQKTAPLVVAGLSVVPEAHHVSCFCRLSLRLLTVFVYLGLAYGCGQLLLLHCVAAGPARALFTVLHKPGNTHPDASLQLHGVTQSQELCCIWRADCVLGPKTPGAFFLEAKSQAGCLANGL